jgi:hypothetical protein
MVIAPVLFATHSISGGGMQWGETSRHMETSMRHEVIDQINAVSVQMTRREKLLRWAALVRVCEYRVALYSNLEFTSPHQRQMMMVHPHEPTAFAVAAKDPEFAAQGLASPASVANILNFFEMDVHEAHVFSCDCGGSIDNLEQARRIEGLAR